MAVEFRLARLVRPVWKPAVFGVALLAVALLVRYPPGFLGTEPRTGEPLSGFVRRLCLTGGGIAALLVVVQLLWRPCAFTARQLKRLLILGLLLPGALVAFLVAPFQAPDEDVHWWTALHHCRNNVRQDELVLFNLPNQMNQLAIKNRPDVKFAPSLFNGPVLPQGRSAVGAYGRLTYPAVALVSLFFPRVHTMQEALIFYYLCRIAPLLALVLILLYANRHLELPYSAIAFFAFPLVLQQCTAISADTLANMGLLLAVILFARLWRNYNVWGHIGLLLLCLLVTYAKFVVGGVLLLPLLLLPFRRLPYKAVTVPLLVALGLIAVAVVGRIVLGLLVQPGACYGEEAAARQAARLWSAEGFTEFLGMYWQTVYVRCCYFEGWISPLGWLDTHLSAQHQITVKFTLLCALAVDLLQYAPRVQEVWERKAVLAWTSGLVLLNAFVLSFTVAAIMYISWTPPGATVIGGIQFRYYYPVILMALLLPFLILGPAERPSTGTLWQGRLGLVARSLAAGLMPVLVFAGTVQLFVRLTCRYW